MRKILILNFAILTILFYSGCSKDILQAPPTAQVNLEKLYKSAVTDAIVADSSEICDTLWAINTNNSKLKWKIINNEKYVLVGNFNKYPSSYADTSLTNSWGIIWVFIPDQFKNRLCSSPIQFNDTLLRMRQLLGIPSSNSYNYIVELWVKPEDLFRPAADSEINDNVAGLYFPSNADTNYIKWFNQNIYDSYFGKWTHYPWTRLGYTYDWANSASEIGVSEYCIKPNSLLYVEKLCLAKKYLNN